MEIIATVRGEEIVIPVSVIIKHNPDQEEDIKFAIETYENDLFAFTEEMTEDAPPSKFIRIKGTTEIDYDNIFLLPGQTYFLLSLISQTDEVREFRQKVIADVGLVRDGINGMKEKMIQSMFARGTLQVDFVDDGYYDHFISIYELSLFHLIVVTLHHSKLHIIFLIIN